MEQLNIERNNSAMWPGGYLRYWKKYNDELQKEN